jgi:hypothetical protein
MDKKNDAARWSDRAAQSAQRDANNQEGTSQRVNQTHYNPRRIRVKARLARQCGLRHVSEILDEWLEELLEDDEQQ